jgi:hypothetical protein
MVQKIPTKAAFGINHEQEEPSSPAVAAITSSTGAAASSRAVAT